MRLFLQVVVVILISCALIFAFRQQSGNKSGKTGQPTPGTTASWFSDLQEPGFRSIFVEDGMKKIRYLRDPDSLVVESTSPCSRHTFERRTGWCLPLTIGPKTGLVATTIT